MTDGEKLLLVGCVVAVVWMLLERKHRPKVPQRVRTNAAGDVGVVRERLCV
jgi:hypothetical protein